MQVFLQIVAFSLQNDGSGRPGRTKGKRHWTKLLKNHKTRKKTDSYQTIMQFKSARQICTMFCLFGTPSLLFHHKIYSFRGTQRGYSSKPLKHSTVNVF